MQITQDILADLIPVYLSGDASDDTRQLISEQSKKDPEFAAMVSQMEQAMNNSFDQEQLPPLSPDSEMQSMVKTKQLLRKRGILLFFALFFSFSPLSCWNTSFGDGILMRDYPLIALLLGCTALVFWFAYFSLKRRMQNVGV